MSARSVDRVLVVEDDASLRRTLERTLSERYREVRSCGTRAEAEVVLREWSPELLLLDVQLPDGDAFDVLREAARHDPAPTVIAMSGEARSDQSFELAKLGVRVYLPKPLSSEAIDGALEEALSSPPDLSPHVRGVVGHRPIHEVEEEVRETMVQEALARTAGSRRGAARLLSISRQLLQHILLANTR